MGTEFCGCDDSVISSGYVCCGCYEASLKARESLRKDREKLVKTLYWYADKKNCDNPDFAHVEIDEYGEEVADGGFLARATLKELGELE